MPPDDTIDTAKVGNMNIATLGFDPDELREKYRQERNKRLRTDGESQYLNVTGELARFNTDDPYAPKDFERAAIDDEVEVAIIGGGFSGMLTAARMREAGITDVRIIEAGADFGGTWYWNRYPGAQCDIDSYCYLPLLEETGYMPKEKYSFASEIYEHSQRIGKTYSLYDITCFQTRVTGLQWNPAEKFWEISTNRNDLMKARFVISATGLASKPKLAAIPGLETFVGHTFHTSRWDYDYTGGDQFGNLHRLADKNVAIIGTGATAIQCIPHLASHAKHLYVFQRTPSSVDRRGNTPTDPEWPKTLAPGWQRERRDNFNNLLSGFPVKVDLVHDGWTDIVRSLSSEGFRALSGLPPLTVGGEAAPDAAASPPADPAQAALLLEIADFKKMNSIRARVDEIVNDSAKAEALKPWYRQFCKRPTFSDEYLKSFNRDNVTLVDTSESRGVERITPHGIVANGNEYKVDCVVYATGFEIGTSFRRRIDFDIKNGEGVSLFDYWGKGQRTFHGHSVHSFPNWFFIGVGQNGLSVNLTSMADEQAQNIAYILNEARARHAKTVEASAEAEAEWVAEIKRLAGVNKDFHETCTPGFYNAEGKFEEVGTINGNAYAPGVTAFNALLERWQAEGTLKGLIIK